MSIDYGNYDVQLSVTGNGGKRFSFVISGAVEITLNLYFEYVNMFYLLTGRAKMLRVGPV